MKFDNLNISSQICPDKIKNSVPGQVYYVKTTDSTNLDAKRAENVPDKSIFIADEQTGGRGRLGREWSSPSGCGIWMSIYLKPQIEISNISQLTLIAGLAASNVIKNSVIKWPNDILIGNKKIAGILTEISSESGIINYAVVGIGINVNNEDFPDELDDKATSLYIETGIKTEREKLICNFLKEFFSLYDIFLKDGFSGFKDEYTKKCVTLNREVHLVKNGEIQKAKSVGITDKGELLTVIDGKTEVVNSCEVSVRGLLGYT